MSTPSTSEPNPPSRRDEAFPQTTTIPNGWDTDAIMERYNPTYPLPGTEPTNNGQRNGKVNGKVNGKANGSANGTAQAAPQGDENLFTRRLDPNPAPNTVPTGWDLSEMYR